MPAYNHRLWGALAALAGIVVAALWAASMLSWSAHLALGILVSLALFALFMLLAPLP
jgi:hypothetical protein